MGCLSRIPDPNFSIPDSRSHIQGQKDSGSRIRIKEFKYFNPKKLFLRSGSWFFNLSRITDPGVKRHRIPDPDPQHWKKLSTFWLSGTGCFHRYRVWYCSEITEPTFNLNESRNNLNDARRGKNAQSAHKIYYRDWSKSTTFQVKASDRTHLRYLLVLSLMETSSDHFQNVHLTYKLKFKIKIIVFFATLAIFGSQDLSGNVHYLRPVRGGLYLTFVLLFDQDPNLGAKKLQIPQQI